MRISLETGMDFQTITKASYVTNCCYRHGLCAISKHLQAYLLCLCADKSKSSSFSHQCLTNYKKPKTQLLSGRSTLLAGEVITGGTGLRNQILPGQQEANKLADIQTFICPLPQMPFFQSKH